MANDKTLEDQETTDLQMIRPELNLEKWSIWQPAHSKNPIKTRVLERELALANGSRVKAKVEIPASSRGALTTEDQKTYYALVKIWEEHGFAEDLTYLSLRRLAKLLNKKWGTNVIKSLSDSLTRLSITHFIWTNSYYNSVTKETLEELDPTFTILTDLRVIRRKRDGHVTKEGCYFKFHDAILKNLFNNYTKPLLLEPIINFKNEIAQLLYVHLDLILANKDRYERRTKELFDDLGLKGKDYNYPSLRKRALEKALAELQGAQLTTGFIISATIERTKDDKDYKAVFQKESSPLESELPKALPQVGLEAQEPKAQNKTSSPKDPDTFKAEEIEARLSALPEEECQAIIEKLTAQILDEYPILEGRKDRASFQKLLKSALKKELDSR